MKAAAAILVETGRPLELVELAVPALKAGQVLVEIAYSGVCHTQLLEARGYRGEDKFLPHCLGHEGSGIVRELGPDIGKVRPDQKVVLSWIKGSGANVPGTVYDWEGKPVNAGAVTTFNKFAVVSENRLTPIGDELAMPLVALLGCAVPTGFGAVLNAGKAQAGQSVVVFGCGGIGLAAVAAAAATGCDPVIAVDLEPTKLALARSFGATHALSARELDPVAAVRELTKGGADLAVEATGRPPVMVQALHCVRQQGGQAVIIGNARYGETLTLDPQQFNQGKRLLGTWGGDSDPDRDYPGYAKLLAGRVDLTPLISASYSLAEVNRALEDLEAGRAFRPLIDLSRVG